MVTMPRRKKSKEPSKLEVAIKKAMDKMTAEDYLKLGLFGSTAGIISKFKLTGILPFLGKAAHPEDWVPTGLKAPWPTHRRRMPWEPTKKGGPVDIQSRLIDVGLSALTSYLIVYHPDAVAKTIDAVIPF